MTDISREQALAHFGVKGMRWGVRNETSSVSKDPKKRLSNKKKVAIGVGVLAVGTAVTLADIAKAHEEETRWMLKNVPGFNPRDNPYLPEYELQRLRTG